MKDKGKFHPDSENGARILTAIDFIDEIENYYRETSKLLKRVYPDGYKPIDKSWDMLRKVAHELEKSVGQWGRLHKESWGPVDYAKSIWRDNEQISKEKKARRLILLENEKEREDKMSTIKPSYHCLKCEYRWTKDKLKWLGDNPLEGNIISPQCPQCGDDHPTWLNYKEYGT